MKIARYISLLTSALVLLACENMAEIEFDGPSVPSFRSNKVEAASSEPIVTLSAEFSYSNVDGSSELPSGSKTGFLYGHDSSLSDASEVTASVTGGKSAFETQLSTHDYGQTIYSQAYITNPLGQTLKSSISSTKIPAFTSYVKLSVPQMVSKTSSSLSVSSSVTKPSSISLSESGFVWSESGTPTLDKSNKVSPVSGPGITATIANLQPAQTINVAAYVKDSYGNVAYSEVVQLKSEAVLATVIYSSYEATSGMANLMGSVTSDGGASVTTRGVEYGLSKSDVNTWDSVTSGSGTGNFTVKVTGLAAATKYYARFFAVNEIGIAYSDIFEFSTDAIYVSGVSLDKNSLELIEGESEALTATVAPVDATNKNVSWKSSDSRVASVDANGKVTAVKAGTATITVTTEDGGKTAQCEVKVIALVGGVSLDKESLELIEGASATLVATITPENATNKKVTWESSDSGVAKVDANGKVTAVKAGTATITVTTEDGGKTASCEVTVIALVNGVSLNKSALELIEGASETLTATIAPANATNKNVSWKSSDTGVATVDANGKVTAVKAGTATITVTTEDGGKTASCEVTVIAPVKSVSLNKTSMELVEDTSETLVATIAPSNASNKNITWKSSAPAVATVDANGKVTAIKVGNATITVTTEDGGKTAQCAVTVKSLVSVASDLSATGTANSYIVSAAGAYKFKTVKGNSSTSVGSVASVEVLWESFGTDTAPEVGELIPIVRYSDGYLAFKASDKKGNAVVAAKNSSGTILWSWHIWLTDEPEDQVYNNNAGTMMDRNLGAWSAEPGSVGALGLLYQWGRKDPFLGSASISNRIMAASTYAWPSSVSSNSSNGTNAYAVSHPTTFIIDNNSNHDWYYTGSSSTDNTRWQTSDIEKGMYDPCPEGYRVPDGGIEGVWSMAFGTSSSWKTTSNWDSTNKGMNFGTTDKKLGSSPTMWYPATGYIYGSDGSLNVVSSRGDCWSASPSSGNAHNLDFQNNGDVNPSYSHNRASGLSVRCLKDGSFKPTVHVTSVSLNRSSLTLTEGASSTLTATIAPSDAANKNVSWESSNTAVATVSASGKVTAVKAGSATITVITEDGGKTATCSVTVNPATISVSSISLNKSSLSLTEGETATLSATVYPSNATNKNYSWKSSSTSVATVSQSGKVTAVKAGTATITVTTEDGSKTATCSVTVKAATVNATDLSSSETANSYIVSSAGTYKFEAVKGNSSTSVGTIASVEVLWESFGTSTAPSVGDLVNSVSYASNYIIFTATSKKGNAVIAAKDASGTILWSWHIWLTDKPGNQTYYNSAGTMMDRNLGATSATPGDVQGLGLLYQWGRKDPFLGSSSISSDTKAASTYSWPSAVSSDSSNGTIAYAVSHPTTFITYNDSNYDWYYTGSSSTDDTRWQTSSSDKGLYDPCPPGYRVPDGGLNGIWSKAFGTSSWWQTSSNWDSTSKGMNFGATDKKLGSSPTIWYPASGYLYNNVGSLYDVGLYGYYWSASPDGYRAYSLYFSYDGSVAPSNSGYLRALGRSVRCSRE